MITALDHIVILAPEIESGAAVYETLLGFAPLEKGAANGAAYALFELGNTRVEVMAPDGADGAAPRICELLEARGPGITTIVFSSDDLEGDHSLFARRGLEPGEIIKGRSARRFRVPDAAMNGLKCFVMGERKKSAAAAAASPGSVAGLDHIVVQTPNPDRAAALYGARFGLDLRLDRVIEQFKTRFLFFKTGGVIFEVVSTLKPDADPSGPDSFGGLTYLTEDIETAQARLADAGLDVSEVRTGRKPGSRVFTVRNGTLNAPTLFISHERA